MQPEKATTAIEKADLFYSQCGCQTHEEHIRDGDRGIVAAHRSPKRALTKKGSAIEFQEVWLHIDYQPLSMREREFDKGQVIDQCEGKCIQSGKAH